jgi:hypothetical protein
MVTFTVVTVSVELFPIVTPTFGMTPCPNDTTGNSFP